MTSVIQMYHMEHVIWSIVYGPYPMDHSLWTIDYYRATELRYIADPSINSKSSLCLRLCDSLKLSDISHSYLHLFDSEVKILFVQD